MQSSVATVEGPDLTPMELREEINNDLINVIELNKRKSPLAEKNKNHFLSFNENYASDKESSKKPEKQTELSNSLAKSRRPQRMSWD